MNMDQLPGNPNTCFPFFNNSFLDLKTMLTKIGSAFAMLKQTQELKPQTRSIQRCWTNLYFFAAVKKFSMVLPKNQKPTLSPKTIF